MYRMTDLSGNTFTDKYGNALKPKAERVKDAVNLLTKMKEFGILPVDSGYMEIKERLNEWIQGGDKWSGIIRFSRISNQAELVLPVKPGKEIMMKILAAKVRQ